MGRLVVRVANALRQPLPDQMDLRIQTSRSNALVSSVSNVDGSKDIRIEGLTDHEPHIVKVFPRRHRPVAAFGIPLPGREVVVQMYAPLDPEHVTSPRFPPYEQLSDALRNVLDCSTVEDVAGCGRPLYESLTNTQKAGMLNLFAKMSAFGFDDQRTVWSCVDRLYRIRNLVEKPKADDAPSNLAIIGRYVLTPEIFTSLETIEPGSGGEIQLTDGLKHMLRSRLQPRVVACRAAT